MLSFLFLWSALFSISLFLILFRDDRDIIINELFCRIFVCKKLGYLIANAILVFLLLPLTIPVTIHHIWNQK